MNSVIRYAPSFPSLRWVELKHGLLHWFGKKKAVLSLDDLTPVTRSSLLAMGYQAAEAEFIWETLCQDLEASYGQQLVIVKTVRSEIVKGSF